MLGYRDLYIDEKIPDSLFNELPRCCICQDSRYMPRLEVESGIDVAVLTKDGYIIPVNLMTTVQ